MLTLQDLKGITKETVARFLLDHGWRKDISRDGSLTRFSFTSTSTSGDPVHLIFTNSASDALESREVSSAVQTLMQIYDITAQELRLTLNALAFDLIFMSIPDEHVKNDSIGLDLASSYITCMTRFLAASATTEISQTRYFDRTLKEANNYASSCRFGHTFHGSFGFLIESPVGLNNSPDLGIDKPILPLERRIVGRMVRGLASLGKATLERSTAPIIDEEQGFSANMCDELAGLIQELKIAGISISLRLSPEWQDVTEVSDKRFKIETSNIEILKEASKQLTPQRILDHQTVFGRVTSLKTEGVPGDLNATAPREVQIIWHSATEGTIRLSVSLDPASYLLAIDAHRNGKNFAVDGTPRKEGRSWTVQGASGARLL